MGGKSRSALLSLLLIAGLAILIAGQGLLEAEQLVGACTLIAGVLLLLGTAVLAYKQRTGQPRQPRLMGEERGVLESEKGFYPLHQADEEQRRQGQKHMVDKPDRAADSVRGFLVEQTRQAKAARTEAAPGKAPGKRRKTDG